MAFPSVSGEYQMTKSWGIHLNETFKQRFEDGSLVLWRPGLTAWIRAFGNDRNLPIKERLAIFRGSASPERFDGLDEERDGLAGFAYRLKEASQDARRPAFYAFMFGPSGHVQMAVYFDDERDLANAKALWRGLHESSAAH